MNPVMDMDRYHSLGPEQSDAVDAWLPSKTLTSVEATAEGEVKITRLLTDGPLLRQCCDATLIVVRHTIPAATPPPWLHPDWTDR